MATLTFTLRRLSTNAPGQRENVSDAVSLKTMLRVFSACERMLTQVERDLAERGAPPGEWRISDTGVGSLVLTLEHRHHQANGARATQAAELLVDSIKRLEREQSIPSELKTASLRQVGAVAGALKPGGVEHELLVSSGSAGGSGRISHPMARQINRMLVKERVSLGTIEGVIELVSVHSGARKFNIYHTVTGKTVKCDLPSYIEDDVIAALKQKVAVSGAIHRNWNGDPVQMKVDRIRILREDNELPSLEELMGSLPDLTGDLRAEEYIRMIRDDHVAS